MSCLLTNGYTLGCRDNTGGIVETYISEYDKTDIFTTSLSDGSIMGYYNQKIENVTVTISVGLSIESLLVGGNVLDKVFVGDDILFYYLNNLGVVTEGYGTVTSKIYDPFGNTTTINTTLDGTSSSMIYVTTAYINSVGAFKFEQEIETGSYTENAVFSTENSTAFYEQTLTITLHKLDAALRMKILTLGMGKWRIIVKDQRGVYHLLGKQNPVRISAATPGVGKGYGDLNGVVLTFMGKEPEPAHIVSTVTVSRMNIV